MTRAAPIANAKKSALGPALLASAAAVGALAYWNHRRARAAEARHPPRGQWVSADGVLLHYIVKGEGPAAILIHGNLVAGEDFVISGLVDRLAEKFKVFVFDRPGYGYSERPGRMWTPAGYAALLCKALEKLGVERATVVGHSYGALVALSLGLDHPRLVDRLVLIGGYYYPSARVDVPILGLPGVPVFGDLLRYTVGPFLHRLIQPALIRILFSPAEPPQRFERDFSKALAARPAQIRAQGEDALTMVPAAAALRRRYCELDLPVTIIAGEDDRWVDAKGQSGRLHEEIPHSRFECIPGVGHMAHYHALDRVLAAIEAPELTRREPLPPEAVRSAMFAAADAAARPGG